MSTLQAAPSLFSVGEDYSNIQQELSSGSVQDLHQVPNALLPNVESVLPGRTGHDVLAVPRKAAALPGGPRERGMHRQASQTSRRHREDTPEQRSGTASPSVSDLFTRSCSFCMGSGSPSRPQVRISLPSYTLMMRSAVFMRKQL